MEVALPYKPRFYQRRSLQAFRNGAKRLSLEWHRKAGKELTCVSILALAALERPGPYYYFFPRYGQAKRVVWEGVDRDGNRFVGHYIPKALFRGKPNETELLIRLKNDATIRLIGLDKDTIDSVIGSNPYGCVFSEYAVSDPIGWRLMSPVLSQNDGWALFNFTPRGMNHATEQHDAWKALMATNPRYFAETLTVDDTQCVPQEVIDEERAAGVPEEMIQQEYYCSRTAMIRGAYFGPYLERARADKRITLVPHDPSLPVHTAWDLGVNDPTVIWFFQTDRGGSIRLIEYYEKARDELGRKGLDAVLPFLKSKPYTYGTMLAPHDMNVVDWSTGRTRLEMASEAGLDFVVVPKLPKDEQIAAAQSLFPRLFFNEATTLDGIRALDNYVQEYDEIQRGFKGVPGPKWATHGADALQVLAVGIEYVTNDVFGNDRYIPTRRVKTDFNVWGEHDTRSSIDRYPSISLARTVLY
jgi:hypothetical protein